LRHAQSLEERLQLGLKYRHVFYLIFFLFLLAVLLACSNGDTSGRTKSGPGFLAKVQTDSLLQISLSFSLNELITHREDEEKIKANLTLAGTSMPVRLASRGITRKKICTFPPLHLHLPESLTTRWGPYKKYKIVTHCDQQDTINELVLKEYLVYKLYRVLTPFAFEVQLSRIRYVTEQDHFSRYGFLIEDDDEMASRVGGTIMKNENSDIQQIRKEAYQIMVLFQYMVGNTDWNLSQRHNIKFITLSDESLPIPVPYDFDYCGLVNAPYAVPYPSLPIKKVRDRFWQYRGRPTDDLSSTVNLFLEKKSEIFRIINEFHWLTGEHRDEVALYLHSFFDLVEQEDSISKIMAKGG
jgi:hypothetical protein